MDFLADQFAGQPIWLWLAFLSIIVSLLWLDLGVVNKRDEVISPKKSALMWAGFASLALAFGAYIWFFYEPDPRYYTSPDNLNQQALIQYYTGYLLETALAFDNIFVISLIFTYFAVPREYQHRVLFWGIIGAVVMRAIFILVGVSVLARFHWIIYIFGAFLVYTGIKMALPGKEEVDVNPDHNIAVRLFRRFFPVAPNNDHGHFFTIHEGRRMATPLFIVLIVIETTDLVFALDSLPAVLAITRDGFIALTSNIFAILGLRSLYFALNGIMQLFRYLKIGLALILSFIGVKMLIEHWVDISIAVSLGVIAGVLTTSVLVSILIPEKK
jgi:tellurite resistance protein TerC